MNKSSSLLLHLYLHLLHFLIMNKSSYFTKKKSPIKIFNSLKKFKISKLKKKKNSKISIPSKNSIFQKKKKKIFIKFFFRNKKLWSSFIFSSGATSSQLSTLSILRSMGYVPNYGHFPGMSNSFQWITLLLIENIYFAGTRVKSPHTLAWVEARKKKKPLVLWKHEPRSKILGLWKLEPGSRTFGPLKTWAKAQKTLGPLKTWAKPQNPRPLKTWVRI